MKNLLKATLFSLIVLGLQPLQGKENLIITASNDPENNTLLVYNSAGKQVQSIPTGGKGGVPPHIVGGGIAKSPNAVAVINYNSQSVSFFKREADSLASVKMIPTASKPVSVVFGPDHLYILGTTTIESHPLKGNGVQEKADGVVTLLVGDGSAAQVGFLKDQLIISERSNMLELVQLRNGAVTENIKPIQLPPNQDDTPVGLATRGNTAFVTIAHSNLVGLVKEGKLLKTVSSETQNAPCWLALSKNWLFCANTPSKSISRYNVSENSLELAELVAFQTNGEPTDIDAEEGILAALELGEKQTSLSRFQIDQSGKLKLLNTTPTARNANGVIILN